MKEKIDQMIESIKARAGAARTFVCKHPFRTALLVLIPPVLVAALVKLIAVTVDLLTVTAEAVALFLDHYLIVIVIAAVAVGWLAERYSKRKAERETRKRLEWEQERARRAQEYATTKEATYTQEGKMVYSVAKDMGGMGIVPPRRLSDIYSPSHTVPIDGGAGMLCQFLIQKAHDMDLDMDFDQLKSVMQTKIDQRLAAGEWPDVKVQHIYDGRVYSGFVIDTVGDGKGYIEVWTALVNDSYCRYKLDQELGKDAPPASIDRRDPDYGD